MQLKAHSREAANRVSFERMTRSEPVLCNLAPASDVVPHFTRDVILTSGPTMPFADYFGGQRAAIIGAARFEGVAGDETEAESKFRRGELRVLGCQALGCVGSLAGVYSASMPVFVVRNSEGGNLGYCNMYEGTNPRRLNYGVYDDGVRDRLMHIRDNVAPTLASVIEASGGIALKPLMKRALHMSDDLHSRNTAAALLFLREITSHLLPFAARDLDRVSAALLAMTEDHYFFLRLSMAAAKVAADAAHGVEGSSVVTAMSFNCSGFAIRISGLGDRWFTGPHASVQAKLFADHTAEEVSWMGGESVITETIGLGGFATAAAFPLQQYQGGTPEDMVERNLELYAITVGENPDFRIPYLGFRGSPTAIDLFKVLRTGILPLMNIGIAGRDGGQIGAGIVRAPMECFIAAADAYEERYGRQPH
jgi:hypothetical protein